MNNLKRCSIKSFEIQNYLLQRQTQPNSKIVLCNYSFDTSKLLNLLNQQCDSDYTYQVEPVCKCFSTSKIRCICIIKILRLHLKCKFFSVYKLRAMINTAQKQVRIIVRCDYTAYPQFNIKKMLKEIMFWPQLVNITIIINNHQHSKLNNLHISTCLDSYCSKQPGLWIDID